MTDQQRQDGAPADELGRWRYTGGVERTYPHVPITVQDGAVVEHVGRPADDGCWEAAGESEVTHQPDNATEVPSDAGDGDAYDDDHDGEQEQFSFDRRDEHAGE